MEAEVLFVILYVDSTLYGKTTELMENKKIYKQDNIIYDVYINVFPAKDEEVKTIDFSSFLSHEALIHDYNSTLKRLEKEKELGSVR